MMDIVKKAIMVLLEIREITDPEDMNILETVCAGYLRLEAENERLRERVEELEDERRAQITAQSHIGKEVTDCDLVKHGVHQGH